jgi:hypothetical protein
MVPCPRALAAQVCLQIRHQQGGPDPFARDVLDHNGNAVTTEFKKVIIVAAHYRLHTNARAVGPWNRRQPLWERPGLKLLRNLQFVGGQAPDYTALRLSLSLYLKGPCHIVEAGKGERIAI